MRTFIDEVGWVRLASSLGGLQGVIFRGRRLALLAVALLTFLLPATYPAYGPLAWAHELESTMGTASTISPSTVAAGGTLRYTLSGFPAGAQVAVLLDDVDTQVLKNLVVGQDGTASGTVELPKLIGLGPHWLRFQTTAVAAATASAASSDSTPKPQPDSPPVNNKSPFFNVGEVTIIGSSTVPRTAGASTARPTTQASQQVESRSRQGSPTVPVLSAAAVMVSLTVVGVFLVRRRRAAASDGGQAH